MGGGVGCGAEWWDEWCLALALGHLGSYLGPMHNHSSSTIGPWVGWGRRVLEGGERWLRVVESSRGWLKVVEGERRWWSVVEGSRGW